MCNWLDTSKLIVCSIGSTAWMRWRCVVTQHQSQCMQSTTTTQELKYAVQWTSQSHVRSRLRAGGLDAGLPSWGLAPWGSGLAGGTVLPEPCPLLVSDTAGCAPPPPLPLHVKAWPTLTPGFSVCSGFSPGLLPATALLL